MRALLLALMGLLACGRGASAQELADRLVWVFGWSLEREADVDEIAKLLETGSAHGLNGAVMSLGLDTLCKHSPAYLERLDAVKAACERTGMELIPSVFSVGYGGGALAHNPNLAEGLLVKDAPFVVRGGEARLVPDEAVGIVNGDFETHRGDRFTGYGFHDHPGEVSFADETIRHGGTTSIRLENSPRTRTVTAGLARGPADAHRVYRVAMWVRPRA